MRSFACTTFCFVILTVAYLIWVLSETISMEFKIRYKPRTDLGNRISPELMENSELLFKKQEGLKRQPNQFSKPSIDVHKLYEHLKDLLQENSENKKISRNITYRKLEQHNENQTQKNEQPQQHNPLEVEKNYRQKDEQQQEQGDDQEKQEQQHAQEEDQKKQKQQQVQENIQEKQEEHQKVERKDPEKSEKDKEQERKKEIHNQTFIKEETQNQNENLIKIQLKENQQMHYAKETLETNENMLNVEQNRTLETNENILNVEQNRTLETNENMLNVEPNRTKETNENMLNENRTKETNENVLKHQIKNKCIHYKIFIWSVGRSGSTIMGSLFQNHPDVVYYYEPLHDLYRQHKWVFERLYGTENRSEILHAAISKIDEIFTESHYNNCNHIVIKELHPKFPGGLIRFSASSRHHHIKFIHLIRDPRAALNSMLVLRWFAKPDLPVVAEKLCKATLRDFKFGSKYMNKSRYSLIKYEKLCTNLTQYVELLLNFTQLKKRAAFNEYVTKLQRTNNNLPIDAYNTERNLTAPVFNWRKSIQIDVVNTIEKYCANMMNALGYKLVNDNMDLLRNLSIPLH